MHHAVEGLVESFLADGFVQEADSAQLQALGRLLASGNHVDRDRARHRIAFEALDHVQATHARQGHIQQHAGRPILLGQDQGTGSVERGEHSKALFARHVHQNLEEDRIIFHREYHRIAGLDAIAVVIDRCPRTNRSCRFGQDGRRLRRLRRRPVAAQGRLTWPVGLGGWHLGQDQAE